MEKENRNIAEEEAMNKLVREILKIGDVKTVFDVESKLKQSFGKVMGHRGRSKWPTFGSQGTE